MGNLYLVRNRILVIFDKKDRTRRSFVQEIKLAAALIESEKDRGKERERRARARARGGIMNGGRWQVCVHAVIKLRYVTTELL